MGNVIYKRKEYIIVKACNGYIVINTKKDFKKGHTHLKSFKKAKNVVDLMFNKKIPHCESLRFLESLVRVSDDKVYIDKLNNQIMIKLNKGKKQKYFNKKF